MKASSQTKTKGKILYQTVLRAPLNNEDLPAGRKPVRIMPYNQATVTTDELAKTIAGRCTVKEPDIKGVLTALSQVLGETLLSGDRLKVDGIGTFNLSLALKKTYDDGRKRHPKVLDERIASTDIRIGRIIFTPDSKLRKKLNNATFVSSGVRADRPLEREEVDEFLTEHFGRQDWLIRREFETHFDISRNQALAWLQTLVAEGALRSRGARSTRFYTPVPGHFGR